MTERRDAFLAAAALALLVETTAKTHSRSDAVGTVGMLELHPGASNSIPSQVELTIDMRDCGTSKTEFPWKVLQHNPSCFQPTHAQLVGRAFHDTGFMGQKFPVAMMFVPSENGYSHCPEESPQTT